MKTFVCVAVLLAGAQEQGASWKIAGSTVTVKSWDVLPLVENEYSKVFTFDTPENAKLIELRQNQGLDEVVAKGTDEFDRQVRLLDWVHRRIKKFGRPSASPKGALEILKAVDEGHTFFCAHYGDVLVSAAAAFGWVDRSLALRRPDNRGSGSTEHTITEIWSNQHRKWVMLDPTFAMFVEKDGRPLNAYEIRDEWFARDGKDLTFVLGAERKRQTKKDFPVFIARHPGFGDLKLDVDCFDTYAFLGYIPNTNLMDAGPDYGRMFITKDAVCDGTKWHVRKNPKDPAHEPYFPIQQAAITLTPAKEGLVLQVAIGTLTPNFKSFQVRVDGKEWTESPASFAWSLREGANTLEALSVNRSGVQGPVSRVDLAVSR